MANNHVRPGQSVTWRNVTGAPVRSGALVPFGGGVAAKALHDIPADAEGEVTLFQVHRLPLPAGLSFSPGDLVHVQDGQISDSGDLLGRFIRLDQGGWAEILILPLTEGGGGGGTSDIAWKPTVSAEGVITWTRTASTTAPAAQNIMGPQGDPGPQGEKGEKGDPGADADARVFVAEYGVTTAQEILAYLAAAEEPFAPMLVRRGTDYYTVITAARRNDESVIIRTFATLSGDYYMFTYTVTNGIWGASSYGFQYRLESGTNLKTVNGQSLLGSGDLQTAPPAYIVDKPGGSAAQLGNVVQVGTFQNNDGNDYGIYEFYYRTTALPTADNTIEYTLLPLLADYTVLDFVDATGVTSNGVFIGNGRTDGTNRVIVQQFSKNRKAVILRAYQDYSAQTALLLIKFIGSKNV